MRQGLQTLALEGGQALEGGAGDAFAAAQGSTSARLSVEAFGERRV